MEITDSEAKLLREALYIQMNNFKLYNITPTMEMIELLTDLNEVAQTTVEIYEDTNKLLKHFDYVKASNFKKWILSFFPVEFTLTSSVNHNGTHGDSNRSLTHIGWWSTLAPH